MDLLLPGAVPGAAEPSAGNQVGAAAAGCQNPQPYLEPKFEGYVGNLRRQVDKFTEEKMRQTADLKITRDAMEESYKK